MRKTEVLLPRASIHPRSRHMIHDSKARRQPSLSKPPPYPSSCTLPPGHIQSESRGPILRLLWPLPGGDSELLSPSCSPFLKEAISNLHRAATLMWQPCNILCIFKESMKMWHLSASSSSRDSLSCGVSTGICHCTNMTAQLIVSSGWAARALIYLPWQQAQLCLWSLGALCTPGAVFVKWPSLCELTPRGQE